MMIADPNNSELFVGLFRQIRTEETTHIRGERATKQKEDTLETEAYRVKFQGFFLLRCCTSSVACHCTLCIDLHHCEIGLVGCLRKHPAIYVRTVRIRAADGQNTSRPHAAHSTFRRRRRIIISSIDFVLYVLKLETGGSQRQEYR